MVCPKVLSVVLCFFYYICPPLGDLCRENGVQFQGYADDTQNWLSFIPGQVGCHEYCYQTLQQCVQKVMSWMSKNFLYLNTDKTEFIMFSTKPQLLKLPSFPDIELGWRSISCCVGGEESGFSYGPYT